MPRARRSTRPPASATARLLLIDCPDRGGAGAQDHRRPLPRGFSVVSNHEYVDPTARHFFMRTEFVGDRPTDAIIGELRKDLPMASQRAHRHDRAAARGAVRDQGSALPRRPPPAAFGGDIPGAHRGGDQQLSDRSAARRALRSCLSTTSATKVAIAPRTRRDSRTCSPATTRSSSCSRSTCACSRRASWRRIPQRIVNIHHSFLPAFVGARPYQQAFERGVKIIGATAHIVTDDLDTGPIIAQDVRPVTHAHTAADMARAGRDVEKIVLAHALTLLLEERVFLSGDRAVVFE
jgi:formyltetrahydrofolate deformylase